ncbi:hypothetical protein HYC85_020913 [Camellia sinensis]|uniref:Uncharacterized protein n=1 Tax=Camellia sinensis TaxID=4442 RepID=A0A7J7GTN5_CAMSI|nr:hypothetical protein HYC85_020913 [Camellia sinensis]
MGEACLGTNYYGVKLVTEELIPLLQLPDCQNSKKELSDTDSHAEEKVEVVLKRYLDDLKEDLLETKGWPVALNAYTRVLAKKYPNIAINAVAPDFVNIDLTYH